MELIAEGILQRGVSETATANLTFPTVTALWDGSLLATWRAGATKDGADETIWFACSLDNGANWGLPWMAFEGYAVDGVWGTVKLCYLTELQPGRLLAAAMWIDRTTYPDASLFNAETEGCLPMSILLAESLDNGKTWSPWRVVPMPDEIGPASLTGPVLKLADGSLALSIETNKHYHDAAPWRQKAVLFHSRDGGQSWQGPTTAGEDPDSRIFNWDLRCGVAANDSVVTFAWTYDSATARYLDIHRRISRDHGYTWSAAEPLGFADQAARPAILPDGRLLLAYVDRFGSRTIRARVAPAVDAAFDAESDVTLYDHVLAQRLTPPGGDSWTSGDDDQDTGALLAEMGLWTFGLPYGEVLPNGDVIVVYYAGRAAALDLHWVRLRL